MEKLRTKIMFGIFLLVLVFYSVPTICQEIENESEFNYVKGSDHGPENWGKVHSEWAACNHGTRQSPIDLMDERVTVGTLLTRLKRSYKPADTTIKNRGHDIMLKWIGGGGTIEINNTEYILNQCHWHAPSEHTIDGRRFSLELNMVHESTDGKIAVVGITYIIGRPDTFIEELMDHIRSIAFIKEEERVAGVLDPRHIKMGSRKYYRYIGSLTVPPCTENVVWTMVEKVRTVSREQVQWLKDAVHDNSSTNARPSQPINNRSIHLYRPKDRKEK